MMVQTTERKTAAWDTDIMEVSQAAITEVSQAATTAEAGFQEAMVEAIMVEVELQAVEVVAVAKRRVKWRFEESDAILLWL